eukprot:g7840.t1
MPLCVLDEQQLENLGRKCKETTQKINSKRPRTMFVALEDVPYKMRTLRKFDFKRQKRVSRPRKRRGAFSKELLISRQKLFPSSCSDEDEESTPSDSECEVEVRDDRDEEAFNKRRIEASDLGSTTADDVMIDVGFRLKRDMCDRLFEYQIEGVKWMWNLHKQDVGGILGDEMGLGKTVQIISFLGSLHDNQLYKASLVLCPVTLLNHWSDQICEWYPGFRVFVLHESIFRQTKSQSYKEIIKKAAGTPNGVILTSYEHFRIYSDEFLSVKWGYVVLDEGHKIKNPDTDITLLVKQVRTRHRLIMTGSPVQNRLAELWSLFDFVFPGKLGTLPVFEMEFGIPIQMGGYKNASRLSVVTAQKCTTILRETILPYILIRRKSQVDLELPTKTENVLFCVLSEEQRKLYKDYLNSDEVESIIRGRQVVLAGIDVLRKICNHPDLLHDEDSNEVTDYGKECRSGKLKVTLKILKKWKEQSDKVLVFTQTQSMLDILESHMQSLGYNYRRMDGQTSIPMRNKYIKRFNNDDKIFVFLLTTRVGGLGVNLTGANRVLLYDPDWNPSIDVQAKERAWRIGQSRQVTVYRLLTVGTIEEKIYQRQIFKQSLKDKVLSKNSQKRVFSSKTIRDLFTLDEEKINAQTETEKLLKDATSSTKQDDEILESVLGDGVKTILDQRIVESCNVETQTDTVSYEANKTAKEALSRMQTAEEQRSKFDVHFPTWTGKHGSAGAPPSMHSADQFGFRIVGNNAKLGSGTLTAPSSSALLIRIQKMKEPGDIEAPPNDGTESEKYSLPAKPLPVPKTPSLKKQKTIVQETALTELDNVPEEDLSQWRKLIIEFFTQRGRVVESEKLNLLLLRTIPPQKRKQFKAVLSQLAIKKQGSSRWVLKSYI